MLRRPACLTPPSSSGKTNRGVYVDWSAQPANPDRGGERRKGNGGRGSGERARQPQTRRHMFVYSRPCRANPANQLPFPSRLRLAWTLGDVFKENTLVPTVISPSFAFLFIPKERIYPSEKTPRTLVGRRPRRAAWERQKGQLFDKRMHRLTTRRFRVFFFRGSSPFLCRFPCIFTGFSHAGFASTPPKTRWL